MSEYTVIILGRLIPHQIPSKENDFSSITEKLWFTMYPETPFLIDLTAIPSDIASYKTVISSNLLKAVDDYRLFCRQVSFPHYKDALFIATGINQYMTDALLGELSKIAYPYHKAFIWKTHMLDPSAYRKDSNHLNDSIVHKVHDKLGGSMVKRGNQYQSEVANVAGAMFRGDVAPLKQLISFSDICSMMGSKSYVLTVIAYRLENLEAFRSYQFFVNSKVFQTNEEAKLLRFTIYGKGGIFIKTFSEDTDENTSQFDEQVFDLMNLRVTESFIDQSTRGLPPIQNIYSTDFSFPGNQQYADGEEFTVTFTLPATEASKHPGRDITGWIKFRCNLLINERIELTFARQEHKNKALHYCDVLELPMMMAPYATKFEEAICTHLNVALLDLNGNSALKCRMLNTELDDFSSVEVFDLKNALIASSYTVGKEALPTINQVAHPETCCIIRDHTEVVYTIRSTNYEWGLLKVFRGLQNNPTVPSGILFLNLKQFSPFWEELYSCQQKVRSIYYKSRTGGLIVDINSARITVPSNPEEFCELLSLGCTLISLFSNA